MFGGLGSFTMRRVGSTSRASAVAVAASLAAITIGLPAVAAASSSTAVAFSAPRHFATAAVRTSALFNRAQGDQVAEHAAHNNISDGVALGDFDGDGNLDAAQTNFLAGSLSVFRGDGRGGFGPPTVTQVGINPSFIVAANLVGDRATDLAVVDGGANAVVLLAGDGHGAFGVRQTLPVPTPRDLALGEVNRDGVTDIAASSLTGASVFVGERTRGDTRYRLQDFVSVPGSVANAVTLGDFDGTGGDDLALGVGNKSSAGDKQDGTDERTGDDVYVYLNRNSISGPLFGEASSPVRMGGEPAAFVVADLDRDSDIDLAVLDGGSGDVVTLLGDGHGHFRRKATNATVGCLPRTLKLADLNGDRIADLVTAHFCASTAAVLLGRGDGTFDPAVEFWTGNSPTAVDVGRVDRDGRPDIVVARLRDDRLSLLTNNSPGRGDGVDARRDIAYVPSDSAPMAAHRTLDVYSPPAGTPSLARRRAYPVLVYAHGGAGIAGDKTMVAHFLRSLAREGVVAVSANYRLKGAAKLDEESADVAAAFAWTRSHISAFGGDAENIVVSGASVGALAALRFATVRDAQFADAQRHVRALVLIGCGGVPFGELPPPTLLVDGTDGQEAALAANAAAFAATVTAMGGSAEAVVVPNRDHFSIVATMARPNDRGRAVLMQFLRTIAQ